MSSFFPSFQQFSISSLCDSKNYKTYFFYQNSKPKDIKKEKQLVLAFPMWVVRVKKQGNPPIANLSNSDQIGQLAVIVVEEGAET